MLVAPTLVIESTRYCLSRNNRMLSAACIEADFDTLYSVKLSDGVNNDFGQVVNPFF